jgi:hypothetical protein
MGMSRRWGGDGSKHGIANFPPPCYTGLRWTAEGSTRGKKDTPQKEMGTAWDHIALSFLVVSLLLEGAESDAQGKGLDVKWAGALPKGSAGCR